MTDNPILARIRAALDAESTPNERAARVHARPHRANTVPKRAVTLFADRLAALFTAQCEAVNACVHLCATHSKIVETITPIWQEYHADSPMVLAKDIILGKLPWSTTMPVTHQENNTDILCATSVAFAGIAETGTLIMQSSDLSAMGQNFLPESHFVILPQSALVGTMEDVWGMVRQSNRLPRSITMITGPSRTGDIEQKIQLGAHGPLRLHIMLASHL